MLPVLAAISASQGGVVLANQALAAGLTREEIRRLVQAGTWTRIRRSAYLDTALWASADANMRHKVLTRATLMIGDASAVICDRSAVAWHGLDTLSRPPAAVHVRVPAASGGRSNHLVVRSFGEPPAHLRQDHGGIAVVTPAVAAGDRSPHPGGVAAGGAAGSRGMSARR